MITSRSRYALKIMMDLAQFEGIQQRRHDIAARHGIPADYMDHILASLREAGLIESIRGRNGGLKIGRPASDIDVWQVFDAVESNLQPVACLHNVNQCDVGQGCITKDVWPEIFAAMRHALGRFSLRYLADKYPQNARGVPEIDLASIVVQECKAPRRMQ